MRDSGIGIPPDKQRTIFDAFSQADGSSARRYGGTGLGLTISSQLVEMMGGQLWVESRVGCGSTFHFTARFDRPESLAARAVPRELAYLHGLPVLVVDDNHAARRSLEETLAAWCMQPSVADSGAAALAMMEHAQAAGRPFALVLLDAQMSATGGMTLAEQLQRHPRLAGVTVMMLGADGSPPGDARCRELGAAAYLTKPVQQADLLEALRVTLSLPPACAERGVRSSDCESAVCKRVLRILLAEDNVVNRKLATRMLEKRGHHVVVAANGNEALAALEKQSFDLVLMDIQMPELDGLEATAEIRRREAAAARTSRRIPIIAMTAHAMKGDEERCLAVGMDGYVSKPIRAERLFAAIDRVLPGAAASVPEADAVSL